MISSECPRYVGNKEMYLLDRVRELKEMIEAQRATICAAI